MSKTAEYSREDKELVDRVLRNKDFYDMLGVTKEVDDSGLKKAYRKLAQKAHPDKNKAPNSDECFKKISAAYDTLSNKEKRHRYDLGGHDDLFATDQAQEAGNQFHRGGNGFTYYYSGNVDPNDIFFNFFQGGGFEEAFGMGGTQQRQRQQQQQRRRRPADENRKPQNLAQMIVQFFPIIVILSYLLQNPLFMKAQTYSFKQTNKFAYKRVTRNLNVQFFVAEDFFETHKDDLRNVEQEIEVEYVQILRENCREEDHTQQNLKMYYTMTWSSREKEQQAHKIRNFRRPHCDKLNSLAAS